MKNLIVYYSYEGNTEEISKAIKDVIKADVLRIAPKNEKKTKSMLRFIKGGIQVYGTKKIELEPYKVDISKYDNIFIGSPCWFGSYAPPINTFLNENKIKNKNIYLFVCSGGNLRNTWSNYEKALEGNNIISKLNLIYPIKTDLEKANKEARNWALSNLNSK